MAPAMVARIGLAFVLAIAGMAHAQRRAVAVIDLSASPAASTLAEDLSKALNNHAELKPLDNMGFNALLQGDFADENEAHLAAARKHKQQAEDSHDQVDDKNAAQEARRGMDELSFVQPGSREMLDLYADLAFVYGRALIGLRNPNEAALAFQLAHRLAPGRTPDPLRNPPKIMKPYNAAVAKPAVAAKLVVRGEGSVWIDGIELGPAGEQFDTSEGMHLIQLTGPERETRGERLAVPSSAPLNIGPAPATDELKVKRARIALARARDSAERASQMKKLAALLRVSDAVLIGRHGNQLSVQTWRDNAQGFSALVIHREEPPEALLVPLAPPPMKIEKRIELEPEPIPPEVEPPWHKKRWVRASILGGVVLGVISAIAYANRDKTLPPLNMNPQWKGPQ